MIEALHNVETASRPITELGEIGLESSIDGSWAVRSSFITDTAIALESLLRSTGEQFPRRLLTEPDLVYRRNDLVDSLIF
jgi:hypothetical protein